MDEKIMKTLLKKATGYSHDEIQEEYAVKEEGEMVLTKRKVTSKYYPPDSGALKTYLELSCGKDVESFSDEELEKEKQRLFKELKIENRKTNKIEKIKTKDISNISDKPKTNDMSNKVNGKKRK